MKAEAEEEKEGKDSSSTLCCQEERGYHKKRKKFIGIPDDIYNMSDLYVTIRNGQEAKRLDEQFDLLTQNIGYLIHPNVTISLPGKPYIADIGTGTGHFLACIRDSHLYPNAVLHGYDISTTMFPEPIPQGITLETLDVKQPVPEHMLGKYHLVHVRLLVGAMQPEDWPMVVQNLARLLKPGGWLQWEEPNLTSTKYFRGQPGPTTDNSTRVSQLFMQAAINRFSHGWNRLHDDMSAAGLHPVVPDIVSSDRVAETREKITRVGMQAVFAWIRNTGALAGEDIDDTEKMVFSDIELGCYYRYDVHIICGQKPL